MSTFVIISCTRETAESKVIKARSTYDLLYPQNSSVQPREFYGDWGVGLFWPGPRDFLGSYRDSSDEGFAASLGWNPHTLLSDRMDECAASGSLPQAGEAPLVAPERSLGIYVNIKARRAAAVCIPDPYSAYPLYVVRSNRPSVISNDPLLPLSLEGQEPIVSKEAVWERVLTEGNLGDRCLFANVRRIRPAEWAWIDQTGVALRTYKMPIINLSAEQILELLRKDLDVLHGVGRPVVHKLTGGRDSRLNIGVALHAGRRPFCYTVQSADSSTATALAALLGLPHVNVGLDGCLRDSEKQAADSFEKIRHKAVFVTGGCGELTRAHYLKNTSCAHIGSAVRDKYLNAKRLALLGREKSEAVGKLWAQRWGELQELDVETGCEKADALYVDRVRSWYGEAWAAPQGTCDVPALVGPAMYAYARNYSILERRDNAPHDALIKRLLGDISLPYLKTKEGTWHKLLHRLPLALQVLVYRLKYAHAARRAQGATVAHAVAPVLSGILTDAEQNAFSRLHPRYDERLRALLERAALLRRHGDGLPADAVSP